MKVATLVDIRIENVNVFNQRVEDLVNEFGGRLIYRVNSRYPIRLLCAEDDINLPAYTPPVPVQGQGVKNGKGNERGRLDADNHSSNRASDCSSGFDAYVPKWNFRFLERKWRPNFCGSRNASADSDCGRNSAIVRIRFPSQDGQREVITNPAEYVKYSAGQSILMPV